MKWPEIAWGWLSDCPRQRRGVRVLQVTLAVVLLFRVFTDVPVAALFWGPGGLGWGTTRHFLGEPLGSLTDRIFTTEMGPLSILFALAAGASGLLVGWQTRSATALALAAFCLLDQRLPETADRGDTLIRLLLIFLVFVLPPGARPPRGSISIWLHNVAVLAIAFQGVVLYATSGLMKVWGEPWQDGTAVYTVSQVRSLAHPALSAFFRAPPATFAASYFTIFYEVLFPIAILSPLRVVWVALGVVFHLAIAFYLGLLTFSAVMIGLDLFFVTDADYARLGGAVRQGGRALATRLAPRGKLG